MVVLESETVVSGSEKAVSRTQTALLGAAVADAQKAVYATQIVYLIAETIQKRKNLKEFL